MIWLHSLAAAAAGVGQGNGDARTTNFCSTGTCLSAQKRQGRRCYAKLEAEIGRNRVTNGWNELTASRCRSFCYVLFFREMSVVNYRLNGQRNAAKRKKRIFCLRILFFATLRRTLECRRMTMDMTLPSFLLKHILLVHAPRYVSISFRTVCLLPVVANISVLSEISRYFWRCFKTPN